MTRIGRWQAPGRNPAGLIPARAKPLAQVDEAAIDAINCPARAAEDADSLPRSTIVGVPLDRFQPIANYPRHQSGVPVSGTSRDDENHSRHNLARVIERQVVNERSGTARAGFVPKVQYAAGPKRLQWVCNPLAGCGRLETEVNKAYAPRIARADANETLILLDSFSFITA